MAWNPDDKISYNELNPALQAMIDSKVDVDNYRSFAQEYNRHKSDYLLHIFQEDRDNWNHAYQRVKDILDTDIGENIEKMGEIIGNIENHKKDSVSHWSIEERNEYNNFVLNVRNQFENVKLMIADVDKKFPMYVLSSKTDEIETNLTDHMLNMTPHITQAERDKWNRILEQAQETASTDLKRHKNDTEAHFIGGERRLWNAHVEDETIHTSPSEKIEYEAHMKNKNVHVTVNNKETWDNNTVQFKQLEARVRLIETEVAALQNSIANILVRLR